MQEPIHFDRHSPQDIVYAVMIQRWSLINWNLQQYNQMEDVVWFHVNGISESMNSVHKNI